MQIKQYRSFRLIIGIIINATLGSALFGYTFVVANSIPFSQLVELYHMQDWDPSLTQGLLSGQVIFFGGLGAYFSKYLSQRYSRKKCFFISNALLSVSFIMMQIPNVYIFIFCRCIGGIFAGFFGAIVPVYIKQMISKNTGQLGGSHQLMITFGFGSGFFISFLTSQWSIEASWRLLTLLPLAISALQCFNFYKIFPYETPKYLILQGNIEQAELLVRVIFDEKYVSQILAQKLQDLTCQQKVKTQRAFSRKSARTGSNNLKQQIQMQLMGLQVQSKVQFTGQIMKELKKSVVKFQQQQKQFVQIKSCKFAIFTALHISILQQMCGITPVAMYQGEIYLLSFPTVARFMPIFTNYAACLTNFYCILVLAKKGRVQLIQLGTITLGVFMLFIGGGFLLGENADHKLDSGSFSSLIVTLSIVGYYLMYSFTLGPVIWLYIPEILEPGLLPIIIMINLVIATANLLLFPILKDNFFDGNPGVLFLIFCLYCMISYFVNKRTLVETKGKTEKQIHVEFLQK